MQRWVAKVLALIAVFIIPFVCTILPIKLFNYFTSKGDRGKRILSCMMCFGGGIFFATYILHMGPEVRSILTRSLTDPMGINYPLAEFLMACGFFIVLYIEKIVLLCHKAQRTKKLKMRQQRCLEISKSNKSMLNKATNNGTTTSDPIISGQETAAQNKVTCCDVESDITLLRSKECNLCPLQGTGECCEDPLEVTTQTQSTDEEDCQMVGITDAYIEETEEETAHTTRSLILMLALSLHRIFEGMSVGLQHTVFNVWSLFLAVMCHETVIGFGLGLQFMKGNWGTRKLMITAVLCSIIMPVGVAIGTIIVEVGEASNTLDMVNGILQALATGTFIYVTFFEILQEEMNPEDTDLAKVTSVFFGFVLMALMNLIPEDTEFMETHINGHNITTMNQFSNVTDSMLTRST